MNESIMQYTPKETVDIVGKVYIEDLCSNYLSFINTTMIKLAVVNMAFFFIYTIIKRFEDKKIISLKHNDKVIFVLNWYHVNTILFDLTMVFNFFVIGYFLVSNYYDVMSTIPVIKWIVT